MINENVTPLVVPISNVELSVNFKLPPFHIAIKFPDLAFPPLDKV